MKFGQPLYRLAVFTLVLILVITQSGFGSIHAQNPDGGISVQAESLVDTLFGDDSAAAEKATAELLRRSGVPIVRANGPLVAAPDRRALVNTAIYVELIPTLARRTINTSWTLRKFTQIMIDLILFPANTPPSLVAELIANWGKFPQSSDEELLTGAAMRALAGHRGQVYYAGVNPDETTLDPLTVTLFMTHAVGIPMDRAEVASAAPAAVSMARAVTTDFAKPRAEDICDAINTIFTGSDVLKKSSGEMGRDSLIELWKKVMDKAVPGGGETLGIGSDTTMIIMKTLTLILMQLGAELKIEVDKEQTTFKTNDEPENDYSKHFNFTAHATFTSALASKNLGCYSGLGLELPPEGNLAGFYVRWKIRGPEDKLTPATLLDSYRVSGEVHTTDFTTPADPKKGVKEKDRLKTDDDGKTQLELMPARYNRQDDETRGVELEAHYTITAQLEKQADLPFTPSDLFGLATSGGDFETFAAKKVLDLILQALGRYNFPVIKKEVTVKYRGQNIYRIKGKANIWLVYIEVPVEIDLLACEGLDKPFIGSGGISGDTKTGFGQAAELLTGKSIPGKIDWHNDNLRVTAPSSIAVGTEYPYQINGDFKLSLRFSRAPKDNNTHLSGVIGEATVGTDGRDFSDACDLFGVCGAHFKIVGVDSDPNCPKGDRIEFHLDQSRKE